MPRIRVRSGQRVMKPSTRNSSASEVASRSMVTWVSLCSCHTTYIANATITPYVPPNVCMKSPVKSAAFTSSADGTNTRTACSPSSASAIQNPCRTTRLKCQRT